MGVDGIGEVGDQFRFTVTISSANYFLGQEIEPLTSSSPRMLTVQIEVPGRFHISIFCCGKNVFLEMLIVIFVANIIC